MARTPVSRAGQNRVSAKVAHLVESGEKPNTPAGRKAALGMAYGMENAGRLGPRGGYTREPNRGAATRPYTPPSAALPRPRPRPRPRPVAPPRTPIIKPPAGELVQATKQLPRMAKGGVVKHPGFKAVQAGIAKNITPRVQGQSKSEAAGAILAASSRNASKAAHKANPRLNRVKG